MTMAKKAHADIITALDPRDGRASYSDYDVSCRLALKPAQVKRARELEAILPLHKSLLSDPRLFERIAKDLREGKRVFDIAHWLGYRGYTQLTRAWTQKTGLSPSAWLAQLSI